VLLKRAACQPLEKWFIVRVSWPLKSNGCSGEFFTFIAILPAVVSGASFAIAYTPAGVIVNTVLAGGYRARRWPWQLAGTTL